MDMERRGRRTQATEIIQLLNKEEDMMKEAYAQSIECEEPCEGRLSRTVLWEGEGETPSLYSTCDSVILKICLNEFLYQGKEVSSCRFPESKQEASRIQCDTPISLTRADPL